MKNSLECVSQNIFDKIESGDDICHIHKFSYNDKKLKTSKGVGVC